MVLAAVKPIDGVERDHDGGGQHRVFQDQIIDPMAVKRRFGFFHDVLSLAPSGFFSVVLASHSPATVTVLRLCASKPRFSKKPRAVSLASAVSSFAPRAVASFSSASQRRAAAPCPVAAGCT